MTTKTREFIKQMRKKKEESIKDLTSIQDENIDITFSSNAKAFTSYRLPPEHQAQYLEIICEKDKKIHVPLEVACNSNWIKRLFKELNGEFEESLKRLTL
jgi:hypothetical protein